MENLPPEIIDRLFMVDQQLKASGMKELSDGELRLYAQRLMGGGVMPGPAEAGTQMSPGGGFLPGGMTP